MLKKIALLVLVGGLFINMGNAQNKATANVVGYNHVSAPKKKCTTLE